VSLAVPVFLLEMLPMLFDWHWGHSPVAQAIKAVLTGIVLFGAGGMFFERAWKAARHGVADMNTLVAIGTGSAFLYSIYAVMMGRQDVYFDTAAVVVAFVLVGKWMEDRAKNRTRDTLRGLLELVPKQAHVQRENGEIDTIPLKQVRIGDLLLVKSFESIPVDGRIEEGNTSIDQSMMTGESMPVDKAPGDSVIGGTRNGANSFTFRAEKIGSDTALAGIVAAVEHAQGSKAPIQRLVDKVAAIFVPVVLGIALITFIYFAITATVDVALLHMVAVLIIACPCALGLATPTAIMVGSGRAGKAGILIKDAVSLEAARTISTILLDKTGTLTTGAMKVQDIHILESHTREEILKWVASVEQQSDHPIARSLLKAAKEDDIQPSPALQVEARAGVGVSGIVGKTTVEIGSMKLLASDHSGWDWANEQMTEGRTLVAVVINREPAALIALESELRPDAKDVITRFKEDGLHVVMLTGDNQIAADAVAKQLGIDEVVADVSPTGKADVVKRYQEGGKHVAMVGDGINDSVALTQADLGIALASGSDLAVSSADITITGHNLMKVAEAMRISKRTYTVIKQNLFWAFVYNSIGIPLAAIGFLSPMIAGAAMALSSVSVVANSLRIK
jgi:Cu+-exporting ATPase